MCLLSLFLFTGFFPFGLKRFLISNGSLFHLSPYHLFVEVVISLENFPHSVFGGHYFHGIIFPVFSVNGKLHLENLLYSASIFFKAILHMLFCEVLITKHQETMSSCHTFRDFILSSGLRCFILSL